MFSSRLPWVDANKQAMPASTAPLAAVLQELCVTDGTVAGVKVTCEPNSEDSFSPIKTYQRGIWEQLKTGTGPAVLSAFEPKTLRRRD